MAPTYGACPKYIGLQHSRCVFVDVCLYALIKKINREQWNCRRRRRLRQWIDELQPLSVPTTSTAAACVVSAAALLTPIIELQRYPVRFLSPGADCFDNRHVPVPAAASDGRYSSS